MRTLKVLSTQELGEINEFLDELKDGTTYKKRLADLEAKKKEINALILVMGKVSEIEGLRLKAQQLEDGADKLVEKTRDELAAAMTKIATDKDVSRKFITERENTAQARIADRERALLDGETNLGAREKVLAKANDDLIVRDLKVASDMTLAKEIRTKYTEAVASLTTEIARIQKVL